MTTLFLSPLPVMQWFADTGLPLAFGKVYTYAAGSSTLLATYADNAGLSTHTNPILLDATGKATIYLSPVAYKFDVQDANGVSIEGYPQDNVQNQQAPPGFVTVADFGAIGDGVHDDTAAVQAAINAAGVRGGTVWFVGGLYLCTAMLSVPSNVILRGLSARDTNHGSCILGKHTGRAVVSFVGSLFCQINDLAIAGHSTITPQTGLLLGRADAGSAGRHKFTNLRVIGSYSVAAVYSIASEENTWMSCDIVLEGGAARYGFYTSQSDVLGIGGLTASSNIHMVLYDVDVTILAGVGASPVCIFIGAGVATGAVAFYGGYYAIAEPGGAYISIDIGTIDGQDCAGGIAFRDVHGEFSGTGPRSAIFLTGTAGRTLSNLILDRVELPAATYYVETAAANVCFLNGCVIKPGKAHKPSLFSQVYGSDLLFPDQNLTFTSNLTGSRLGYDTVGATLTISGLNKGNQVFDAIGAALFSVGNLSFNGAALIAGNFALSGGWGSTASISAVSGNSSRTRFTVTSTGVGQGASPTITLTWNADHQYTAAPLALVQRSSGSQPTVTNTWTTSTTTLTITFVGTPVAAETYTFDVLILGVA